MEVQILPRSDDPRVPEGELSSNVLVFPSHKDLPQPNPHLPMDSVGEDWIRNVEDIKTITVACQPAFRVRRLFDESWDPDNVHFIVMAEAYA